MYEECRELLYHACRIEKDLHKKMTVCKKYNILNEDLMIFKGMVDETPNNYLDESTRTVGIKIGKHYYFITV